MGKATNEQTAYNSDWARSLRAKAVGLGAVSTYYTKKIEFFRFPSGRCFLLEPDRKTRVNIGFVPGFEGDFVNALKPIVGKNSNVKSHWRLPNNHFSKIIVEERNRPGAISLSEAVELLTNISR